MSAKTYGGTSQADIHRAACSVLSRVGKCGDVRVVDRLVKAVPERHRKALQTWFASVGPIAFVNGKAKYSTSGRVLLAEAIETPFWRFKRKKAYVPVDVVEALDKLISTLRKDRDRTGSGHSTAITELLRLRDNERRKFNAARTRACKQR